MKKLIIFAFLLFIIVSSSEGTDTRELVDSRNKRGLLEDVFEWFSNFPGVEWITTVGSTQLGAAFGLIIRNNVDLKISLLSGHVQVEFHNEVFARANVHGLNVQISLARVCYKGGARYNLNLQEFDLRSNEALVRLLTEGIRYVGKAITPGIDYISELKIGNISFWNIIDDFLQAFKSLPDMVSILRDTARKAMEDYGNDLLDNLPAFSDPMRYLTKYFSKLMSDIKIEVRSDGVYIRVGASCGNGYSEGLM